MQQAYALGHAAEVGALASLEATRGRAGSREWRAAAGAPTGRGPGAHQVRGLPRSTCRNAQHRSIDAAVCCGSTSIAAEVGP